MKTIYLQAFGFWFILMMIAIMNGTLRTFGYGPIVEDELLAHQISTGTAIILFLSSMYVFLKMTNAQYTGNDLWMVGFLWLGMTIIFEFVFGHFVMGTSWDHLLADYDLLKGRIWVLVLITTVVGPFFIGRYILKTV